MKRHHVDPRDIDPFGGNDELRERAEKAYDATIAREKADAATPRGRDHPDTLGNSGAPLVLQRDTEGDTRPPTAVEVIQDMCIKAHKEMVEGSAALNSTSGAHPHTPSPTESRKLTQGEAMAATPQVPAIPQQQLATSKFYQEQIRIIRNLPPSVMSDIECEEMRKAIKIEVDSRKAYWAPLKDNAHKQHKLICEREAMALEALLACDDACRIKIGEHARLQRIEAEKERLRKEAIERQRRADEAKAQAEALAAQAADAEKAGDAMQAEMLMEEAQRVEQAPIAPVVLPPVEIAKPQGSVVVAKKKVDMSKLDRVGVLEHLLGVADHPYSSQKGYVLHPNESLIAELLDFKEGAFNRLASKGILIPGAQYYEVDEVRSKGR